jgi:hypothetical protein
MHTPARLSNCLHHHKLKMINHKSRSHENITGAWLNNHRELNVVSTLVHCDVVCLHFLTCVAFPRVTAQKHRSSVSRMCSASRWLCITQLPLTVTDDFMVWWASWHSTPLRFTKTPKLPNPIAAPWTLSCNCACCYACVDSTSMCVQMLAR